MLLSGRNEMNNIKVVILCGGLGTRLREETEFRPKPMVEIGGKPILWHIMKIYAHYGFKDFVLCLGYKGEMIKEYFYNYEVFNNDFTIALGKNKQIEIHSNHDESDWKVTLADTGANALKGARLKKIEKYIDSDNFMMTYGDGVSNINIRGLVEFHRSHGKIATISGVNPTGRFGKLKMEGERVVKFFEKPEENDDYVNGGFCVFNRKIFDYLNVYDDCDLEYGPLEQIATEGEMMVHRHDQFWSCMDTLRDAEYLNKVWAENRAEWKIW